MKKNLTTVVVFTLVLVVLIYCIYSLSTIFLPVFIALILAYLLEPLVIPLEKKGINRTLAIFVVFAGFILLIVGSVDFLVVALKKEFSDVQINLPAYAARLYDVIPLSVKTYLEIETPDKAYLQLVKGLDTLKGISFDLFKESFTFVTRAFASTLAFLLAILGYLITPVYLYYFLKDLPKLKKVSFDLVPCRLRDGLRDRLAEVDGILSAFIRGQLSVCAILAVLYSIGLYFIGIDLAIVIGTLAGITFIIPYVGTVLGILLAVSMALLKYHDLFHPVLCICWFALVQAAEGGIITPKIVGDKVGLHPVVTILALFIGGQLFGIIGMFLAVPITAALKVAMRELMTYYRTTYFFTGE